MNELRKVTYQNLRPALRPARYSPAPPLLAGQPADRSGPRGFDIQAGRPRDVGLASSETKYTGCVSWWKTPIQRHLNFCSSTGIPLQGPQHFDLPSKSLVRNAERLN